MAVERSLLNARIHFIYHVTVQKEGEKERGWEYFRSAEAQLPELERLVGSSKLLAPLYPQVNALRDDLVAYKSVLIQIIEAVDEHQNSGPDFTDLRNRWAALGNTMVQTAGTLSAEATKLASAASSETSASLSTARKLTLTGSGCMLLLSAGVAAFLIRRIGRTLGQAAVTISESATQITETAASMSESAKASSQRASDQAASVEETSAAALEVSSMASKNVDHARRSGRVHRRDRS